MEKSKHPKKRAKIQTLLGRNVNRLRKECGWSFDELAKQAGVDKSLILRLVNDGKGAHPKTLKLYADAFARELNRSITVPDLEAAPQ